jgi:4-hydroxyphenylpyruvate dioxygenase
MINSIATVSLSGTLDQKLDAIAGAGFEGVEIFENDLLGFDGTPRDVARMIRDLGLVCTCYQPFRDFEGLPPALRDKALARAEAKFDVMQEIGAELMLVCSSIHPAASGDYDRIVDDFRLLGERAARRRLRVGYEALSWGRFINDHRDAWEIVRRVDHSAIGLVLDSFHSLARRIPIDSIPKIAPDKIFLVQIADAPEMPMGHLYWSRHFRCFPFQGDLPVTEYVRAVAKTGYKGALSLEIFNDRFREWSAKQIADDGIRSIAVLQDRAGTRGPLPPRVKIGGIDFIEFAVSSEEAQALGSLFQSLGFAHVGNHRSKAVSLWRQGEMHLVINCDPNGWANAHRLEHGASVCAIALRVESARAALLRAGSLGIATFEQSVAAGELSIPWIRGVGGALTYFTEPDRGFDHWTHDFIPVAQTQDLDSTPLKLIQIDHITQVMRVEEFLSWQLYYTSLFDLSKTPPLEITDTFGLVQSQAIEADDGRFRVILNGSSANQTLAARFVQGPGSGVQHMAFSTNDIRSAAGRAQDNGLAILPVPINYYDDLRARFGLSEAQVKELRDANMFYDRDGEGEYFQLYTRAFDKRVFFEIVERRDYRGYGAANSSVRLAAQSRYRNARRD